MPNSPIISIIIPCYNSEAFLQETIDRLMIQGTDDCEIVLVDDGSKDKTLQIMKEYEEKYANIVVVTQENKGVSAARNRGILTAQGDYLYFLDSDDYLADGALEYYKMSIRNNTECDMLGFGYKMLYLDGGEKLFVNANFDDCSISGPQTAELFYIGKIFLNVCSILLKRCFIIDNQLLFKEGIKIGEDYDFIREVVLKINKLYYSKRICFVYKLRKGSATDGHNGYGTDNFNSLLLSFECAKKASNILSQPSINYYKAARYSAHLKSYLKSSYVSEDINLFFKKNRDCLFEKMSKGRSKVLVAINIFRLVPLWILFLAFGKQSKK